MKSTDIERALSRKGFQLVKTDHRWYVFYYLGKATVAKTCVSHSQPEIDENLVHKMSKQLFLKKQQFERFVECSFSEDDYIDNLKDLEKI